MFWQTFETKVTIYCSILNRATVIPIVIAFCLLTFIFLIIKLRRLYEETRLKVNTDDITKLYNERHFYNTLLEYFKYEDISLTLLFIEIDHFKLFNRLYGRCKGDKLLSDVAKIILSYIGCNGIAFRYSGDEFAIIFPNATTKIVLNSAENIKNHVERKYICNNLNFISVSMGFAQYPEDAKTIYELIDKAMIALDNSKRVTYDRTFICDYSQINNFKDVPPVCLNPIYSLAAAIDIKDHYTYNHSHNVAFYSMALAKAIGLDSDRVQVIYEAGLLHDIGKIGIPENILDKPSKLTDEEYEVIKEHVNKAINIIKYTPSLNKVIPAILSHHERWDGKGYPRRIKGEEIPIEGRCLSVADAFDSMTTDRPYRNAMSVQDAVKELRRGMGTQFDANLVNVFIDLIQNRVIQVE